MTGVSLGLRTGSYGSLQLIQNGNYSQVPVLVRRPSKTLLYNPKDKERGGCPYICRHLGRGKVAMLLMLLCGLFIFVFGCFTLYKGGNIENPQAYAYEAIDIGGEIKAKIKEKIIPRPTPPLTNRHKILRPVSHLESSYNLKGKKGSSSTAGHLCDNFAFPPPPPANRRRTGPRPCPVCYVPVEQAIASMPIFPSESPVLRTLTYAHNENMFPREPEGGSDFGGYPSLEERDASFDIKETMKVHCGFVKGSRPGRRTGFDFDEEDLLELDQYHDIIVASAIFGNYDVLQQPRNISRQAKKNIPFFMFIDKETEIYMRNASILDSSRRIGLWRIIVVRNIPYADSRRNGKIPKLLLHRIFPNIRYSIWIDGKLELVADPYLILERFLWRPNATFAISRHYRRFDVFVEAEANKVAGKYENASIDRQVQFYQYHDGLTHYSRAKLPITSDVPEGCVIIREHIPITNLFTCLWFNEVDRFTSRDQLSFSTVRDKIMAKVDWSINMFLDCERRNFVIQAYHRDVLENMPPPSPPVVVIRRPNPPVSFKPPAKKNPRHGRGDRRSGRRHRKVVDNVFMNQILI